MKPWMGALRAEGRKTRGSVAPWATGLAGLLFPAVGGLFMLIVKDPEGSKKLGLLGAKARLSGLTADWDSYLSLLCQAEAVGFLFLSALFTAWLFGRESSDRTLKLLLAVPVGRTRIVLSKFFWALLWGVGTVSLMAVAGLGIGALVGIPGATADTLGSWAPRFFLVGGLTLALCPWVAFFASVGKGYLAPLAWTLFTLALANIGAILGWGELVPWSVPSLVAGAGTQPSPDGWSFLLVGITGTLGVLATLTFWNRADHSS